MSTPQTRSARKTAARGASTSAKRLLVLVATRKGAWFFHSDAKRKAFTVRRPALPRPQHQPRAARPA